MNDTMSLPWAIFFSLVVSILCALITSTAVWVAKVHDQGRLGITIEIDKTAERTELDRRANAINER